MSSHLTALVIPARVRPQGLVRQKVIRAGDEHRAGIVVSGELHRSNGHVTVQAWITDVAEGSHWAVSAISAPADSAERAIEQRFGTVSPVRWRHSTHRGLPHGSPSRRLRRGSPPSRSSLTEWSRTAWQ